METCAVDAVKVYLAAEAEPCAYYVEVVDSALITMTGAGFVSSGAPELALVEADLWVRGERGAFHCPGVGTVWGCYDPDTAQVEVSRAATSLVHEWLHRLGHVTRCERRGHPDWGVRGAAPDAPVVGEFEGAPVHKGSWIDVANTFARTWETRARLRGVRL
jgi:hypothetical protein